MNKTAYEEVTRCGLDFSPNDFLWIDLFDGERAFINKTEARFMETDSWEDKVKEALG